MTDLPDPACWSGLLAAVTADPGDDTAWLVLADWLEEQGRAADARVNRLSLWLRRKPDDPDHRAWQAERHALLARGVRPVVPTRTFILPGAVPLALALVPPGSFDMGTPDDEAGRDSDDEGPVHRVTLTGGFWLGVHLVTCDQWMAVCGMPPGPPPHPPDLPVDHVSWDDADAFCKTVRRITRERVRLPTEAEWEFACRAGTTTRYYFGDDLTADQACFRGPGQAPRGQGNSRTPSGRYPPNAFGLCDLHGNLWEWCHDRYSARYYARSPAVDPTGPARGGERVCRGGSYFNDPTYLRSGNRAFDEQEDADDITGFRIALDV